MPFTKAGQLTRFTPAVRIDDSLGLVAENLRSSPHGVLPVLDRTVYEEEAGASTAGRVLGLINERDLSRVVMAELSRDAATANFATADVQPNRTPTAPPVVPPAISVVESEQSQVENRETVVVAPSSTSPEPHVNGHAASNAEPEYSAQTVRSIMRQDIGVVPAAFSLHNALLTLQRYDSPALPVVDETGNYRGMISRVDVVAALEGNVRPPLVGGMATPLGVWLTTGHLSAGSSAFGLFLSGVMLSLCLLVAHWVMLLGLTALNRDWGAIFVSSRLGTEMGAPPGFGFFALGGEYLLFLLFLRALPLAGVHAAEHQTVWAIERGLPLTPEHVGRMPRAHPRCGTNLAALAVLFIVTFQHMPTGNESGILFMLLFIFLVWRSFGKLLQDWFTTKPPTTKQLEDGIAAGKALIAKYQEQPHLEVGFGQRLFNSGLIMMALGMIPTLLVLSTIVEVWLARWILSL